MRIDYALRQHEQWYLEDGHYGDGSIFRADYYHSYVILPFLLKITQTLKGQFKDWDNLGVKILDRAKRDADVQNRMIIPNGSSAQEDAHCAPWWRFLFVNLACVNEAITCKLITNASSLPTLSSHRKSFGCRWKP